MMYRFGPSICSNLAASTTREWLVTDGLGGYAMGTVGGLRTRRAHGLLVVATPPAGARMLGLAALDLTVVIGDNRYPLYSHESGIGVVDPQGYRCLTRFDIVDGLPRWYWAVAGVVVSLQLAMQYGESTVGLVYRVEQADAPITLELEPLVTWRPIDGDRIANVAMPALDQSETGVVVDGRFRIVGDGWKPGGTWRSGVHYRHELKNSHLSDEDLTSAGRFEVTLAAGDSTEVVAWSGDLKSLPPAASDIVLAAQVRSRHVAAAANCYDDIDRSLVLSADNFILGDGGVVAGYPGLAERSRDSLIAYRGLFLETARYSEGRDLLLRYAARIEHGLLSESEVTEPLHFTSVDASLWLFQAVNHHVDATGDLDLASAMLPVMAQVVNAFVAGTRHGIAVDDTDGLLELGVSNVALTWMDSVADGVPVTPRWGKPVEVNALWLSALGIIRNLAEQLERSLPSNRMETIARQAFARYGAIGGGLADVIDGPDGVDRSRRPNQLLAVTLPFPASTNLSGILEAVQPLVTPAGLRTLASAAMHYRGVRDGSVDDHQGTVWPWLIGPYADAVRLAAAWRPGLLEGLEDHVPVHGVGSVSAMLSGDTPFDSTGSPFHAMGTAEMLRVRRNLR
jgi:predicted glycogen debranching enzyme